MVACTAPHRVWPRTTTSRVPYRGSKLDAADQRRCDDVAGHPDHKQIAQALVEDDLHRNARVGATENRGDRFLACGQLSAAGAKFRRVAAGTGRDEAAVSLSQALQRFMR